MSVDSRGGPRRLIAHSLMHGANAPMQRPRPIRSIRPGRSRCRTTGWSAPSSASPSTRRITSGSRIVRRRCSRTRRARSGRRRRRCSSSIRHGNLVSSWGGPGAGYEWPQLEHGIYVDHQDNVWLGGGGDKDAQILKFTRQGKFLMQIGHQGKGRRQQRHAEPRRRGATWSSTRAANELYVADGYVNHRVIVFDATTGAYKRHWGAYGKKPDDSYFTNAGELLPGPFSGTVQHENKPSQYDPNGPPPPQFRIVHAVRISNDGLVYVCDRTNDRMQVFRKDGTFVQEAFIAKETFGSGSVWDIGFSTDPEQTFLIVIDGTNQQVYVVLRKIARGRQHVRRRRPLGRPVLRRAQPRGRLEGQSVHHGNLRGKARAEVHLHRHGSRAMMSQLLAAALAGPVAFAICALPHEQRPIRTADITIRGLKVSDFPAHDASSPTTSTRTSRSIPPSAR